MQASSHITEYMGLVWDPHPLSELSHINCGLSSVLTCTVSNMIHMVQDLQPPPPLQFSLIQNHPRRRNYRGKWENSHGSQEIYGFPQVVVPGIVSGWENGTRGKVRAHSSGPQRYLS